MNTALQQRVLLLSFTLLITSLVFGQHPISKIDKATHLELLKDGVLLVRLSDQNKKIVELQKRGQNIAAQNLEKELSAQNNNIIRAFQTHFNYCKVYFIRPKDTKSVITNKSKAIINLATEKKFNLTDVNNIYVTDYSYGHPADGHERYNRKGFQILSIEDGEIRNIGRDLFYAGVKQGFFSAKFNKSLQKTIIKLNRRLTNGSRYL